MSNAHIISGGRSMAGIGLNQANSFKVSDNFFMPDLTQSHSDEYLVE